MNKKSNSLTTPFTLALVALLLVGVGSYAFTHRNMSNAFNSDLQGLDMSPIQTSGSTSWWKTYTDTTEGFSFKYPAEWEVKGDSNPTFTAPTNQKIQMFVNKENTSNCDSLEPSTSHLKVYANKKLKIDGYDARYISEWRDTNSGRTVNEATLCITKTPSVSVTLSIVTGDPSSTHDYLQIEITSAIFDNIFSTFKLAKISNNAPITQ